jgi:DNA-binding transcriptional LysR family regulator
VRAQSARAITGSRCGSECRRPAWATHHLLQWPVVIELRQLKAFVAVADEGTFVAAAQQLGVVQPAVSQAVRRLEDELGLVLFDRSSRRVTLTSSGEAFLPEARAVLARLAAAEQVARDLGVGRSGLVRLATTPGAPGLVAALLAHQRAAHPDVEVELVAVPQHAKLRAVVEGDIDVALTHTAAETPGVAFTQVWREPWLAVVSASHPLAGRPPVGLAALAGHPLVLVAEDGAAGVSDQFAELCAGAGFAPTVGRTYATLSDALVEIGRTHAWTLMRASNAGRVGDLGLVALPVADEHCTATLWLAHRPDPPPAVRALVGLASRLSARGELLAAGETAGGPEA